MFLSSNRFSIHKLDDGTVVGYIILDTGADEYGKILWAVEQWG